MQKRRMDETCAEAVRASFQVGEVLPFSVLFTRTRKRGKWTDATIWQHLMSLVVNLPPARYHWKHTTPFLFLRPDGQYEIYDERRHPKVVE